VQRGVSVTCVGTSCVLSPGTFCAYDMSAVPLATLKGAAAGSSLDSTVGWRRWPLVQRQVCDLQYTGSGCWWGRRVGQWSAVRRRGQELSGGVSSSGQGCQGDWCRAIQRHAGREGRLGLALLFGLGWGNRRAPALPAWAVRGVVGLGWPGVQGFRPGHMLAQDCSIGCQAGGLGGPGWSGQGRQ
jgi:hypothetical protein